MIYFYLMFKLPAEQGASLLVVSLRVAQGCQLPVSLLVAGIVMESVGHPLACDLLPCGATDGLLNTYTSYPGSFTSFSLREARLNQYLCMVFCKSLLSTKNYSEIADKTETKTSRANFFYNILSKFYPYIHFPMTVSSSNCGT